MRAHATKTVEDRTSGQEEVKLEITGGRKAPHVFVDAEDNTLASFAPTQEEVSNVADVTTRRLEQAIYRDSRYGQAGQVWMRKHGRSQALREIYDGAIQLVEGGIR